jgi:putative RNA 2'-phosphotransferase
MRTRFDPSRLISTMAFALRHDPACFCLDLDEEGWASLDDLITAIRFERYDWNFLDETLVRSVIGDMDRFEIRDGRIRAVYGHSIELAKQPPIATPPEVLFHGTASGNLPSILQNGISRMRRRFAHFSTDYEWVVQFLSDKPEWTILAVNTFTPSAAGVVFRKANHHVWLADWMDPRYLLVHSSGFSAPASTASPS